MRTQIFCVVFLLFFLTNFAQTPGCEWVNFPTGTNANHTFAYSSTYDKSGNSFVVGAFDAPSGVLDLDPSANTFAVSGFGIYLAKYDPAGAVLWVANVQMATQSMQGGFASPDLACDTSGNVYITGGVRDVTIDFDYLSSSNTPLQTSGGGDMYLAKYSSAGVPLWSFLIGAAADEEAQTIICEGEKVYVGGFYGSNTDFDPSAGTYIPAIPLSCTAGFIAMYTSSGQFVWHNTLQGLSSSAFGACQVWSLAIDKNLQLLACGIFWGIIDFSPVPNYDTLSVFQAGNYSGYIAKYDSTGTFTFVKRIDNYAGVAVGFITVDIGNNIVVGGYFDGITDFDMGPGVVLDTVANNIGYRQCFIAKYDASCNYLWHGQFGSSNNDYINDIAVDDNNNILVGGSNLAILDADMGAGVFNLPVNNNCNGCEDGFVAKYTSTGQLILGFSVSAWANDGVWSVGCFEDKFSITGIFSGLMDFQPSADTMMIPALVMNGFNYYHAQYFDSTFVSGIPNAGVAFEELVVYPNPSSDFIYVENFSAFESFTIVNVAGQTVQAGKTSPTIDVRDLAAGTYLLTLVDENGVLARAKIVRQ